MTEVNTCKTKIFIHNITATSKRSMVDGHNYLQI